MKRFGTILGAMAIAAAAAAQGASAPAGDAPRADPKPPEERRASVGDIEAALVRGAPVGNENVSVHAVERKPYTNHGRQEVALFPAVAQVNGKFTTHVGFAAMYAWHFHENLAFQATPLWNFIASDSPFNQELVNKARLKAQAATALVTWSAVLAGIEVAPIYGKFAFYDATLLHFGLVLNAGVGAGLTRLELVPAEDCQGVESGSCAVHPAASGDTGLKFMGSVGGGFRIYSPARQRPWLFGGVTGAAAGAFGGAFMGGQLFGGQLLPAILGGVAGAVAFGVVSAVVSMVSQDLALRLEVRDIVYTARVDRVNGCDGDDLTWLASGPSIHKTTKRVVEPALVSAGCNYKAFESPVDDDGIPSLIENQISIAKNEVRLPSSDVLNNILFFGGISFVF